MTPARLEELRAGLTTVARAVLDATPINEAWTPGEICTELGRTGRRADFNVVLGCLDSLKAKGLVREPTSRRFMRPPDRRTSVPTLADLPNLIKAHEMARVEESKAPPKAHEPDPLAILGNVASRLRLVGKTLAEAADEIESAALLFETRVEREGEQADKLKQLGTLLRSLGVG